MPPWLTLTSVPASSSQSHLQFQNLTLQPTATLQIHHTLAIYVFDSAIPPSRTTFPSSFLSAEPSPIFISAQMSLPLENLCWRPSQDRPAVLPPKSAPSKHLPHCTNYLHQGLVTWEHRLGWITITVPGTEWAHKKIHAILTISRNIT